MTDQPPVPVTVGPRSAPWIDEAVVAGGGVLVDPADADGIVWTHAADPGGLRGLLDAHPHIGWVQLPWAGVDAYLEVLDDDREWVCAKGVYSAPVAEMALALLLAGFRGLSHYARQTSWSGPVGRNLHGAAVTVVGGGGIARAFIDLLAPFGCAVTVVRTTPEPMEGVDRVLASSDLHAGLADADALVLALPLLPATHGLIGAVELDLLAPGAWLVNVARGAHVDTDALVAALESGHLGGAALDVTDPEPLPDGHPLWSRDDVVITPHVGNTPEMAKPLLGSRITDNVRRRREGRPLVGRIDAAAGY